MKTPDINELVKERLTPFLTTQWSILPSEDLNFQIDEFNKREKEIEVIDANNILWFARGLHNSIFFLKDYSLESKVPGKFILPTEYLGALVVHQHGRCILSASWHGYEFILMDTIKTSYGPFPITKKELRFYFQLVRILCQA